MSDFSLRGKGGGGSRTFGGKMKDEDTRRDEMYGRYSA